MRPRRGDTQQSVAFPDIAPVYNFLPVDNANGKTCHVVFSRLVETGHLRGLAPEQGASGFPAARGHALHQFRGNGGVQFTAGDIVQKKKRPCPVADHVVHAHGHKVYSHRIVLREGKRKLQFGTHPVGPGNQHRLFHAFRSNAPVRPAAGEFSQREHPGKTPDTAENRPVLRRFGQFPVFFYRPVALLNIDTGLPVIHGNSIWGKPRIVQPYWNLEGAIIFRCKFEIFVVNLRHSQGEGNTMEKENLSEKAMGQSQSR